MRMQTVEVSLSNELLEGEELIWSGRPEPQKIVVIPHVRMYRVLGYIMTPLGLALLFLLTPLSSLQAWSLIFALVALLGIFSLMLGFLFLIVGTIPLLVRKTIQQLYGNAFYAITDRRVIIARNGSALQVDSYSKSSITRVSRVERPDGSGDLSFFGDASPSSVSATSLLGTLRAIPNVHLAEQKLLEVMGRL